MKIVFPLLLMALSAPAVADLATYSSSNQTLSVPLLAINGSVYYENVEISLNTSTGKFNIMAANKISADKIGNQTVTVSSDSPGTLLTRDTLELLYIQDSRCPADVQCIIAGEIIIGLQLHDFVTDSLTVMELQLEGNGSIAGDGVKTEEYTFSLLEANPYPESEIVLDDNDYTFTIEYSINPG
ncbi:MAG: hypothetical protein ACI934_000901 [Pseudohongiellaceae bacterium]